MAIGASTHGGTHQHGHAAVHSPLSAAEHHAASKVLAKLGLSSSSNLGRASADSVKVGSGKTAFQTGHDKTAMAKPAPGADKLVGGSSHAPTLHANKSGVGTLSSAKIGVSGATAASVKEHASHTAKAKTAKLTGSDKTSVHITGVSLHHLTKGGGSDK